MNDGTGSFKKVVFILLSVCFLISLVVLVSPEIAVSQPGLPSDPEQTPIDGGLGILAALGGTYAIKKLRDKKE